MLTWRDPTATKIVLVLCLVAAAAVAQLGLPTVICAVLLHQVTPLL